MSSLERAEKLQKKAAEVGFDWQNISDVISKVKEETCEVEAALAANNSDDVEDELSDLLFSVVNLVRFNGTKNSEELLRAANRKFERRFNYVEQQLAAEGIALADAGVEKMESLWQQCKQDEQNQQN